MTITTEHLKCAIATATKKCPFCGNVGLVYHNDSARGIAIRCKGCTATFARSFPTLQEALRLWSLRLGTASAAGGRATRGTCSRKKRKTCRRNLKLARDRKKILKQRLHLLVITPLAHALRAFEVAHSPNDKKLIQEIISALEPTMKALPSLRPYLKCIHLFRRCLNELEEIGFNPANFKNMLIFDHPVFDQVTKIGDYVEHAVKSHSIWCPFCNGNCYIARNHLDPLFSQVACAKCNYHPLIEEIFANFALSPDQNDSGQLNKTKPKGSTNFERLRFLGDVILEILRPFREREISQISSFFPKSD